jgi:hypothetical protein
LLTHTFERSANTEARENMSGGGSGLPADVAAWTTDDVQQWLQEHHSWGWDEYAAKFQEERVHGKALMRALQSVALSVGILARGVRS